jgi:L-threonylcarbamoyladenylate synthase
MTEIIPTNTHPLFQAAVTRAARLLRAGEIVALPTETVYGLAANALNAGAVEKIYQAKGRPAHNPIIVHVAGLELARNCVARWPETAARLAASFWPGPLTLVLSRSAHIPDIVTAGGDTVGVRWPAHPFIQAVIRECGFPLAAPSANLSNALSPTSASHVARQLDGRLPLIVDGGECAVGIESTVVDLTGEIPAVLRPGMIHQESLIAVTGDLVSAQTKPLAGTLRSPGQLQRHYAPRARLHVCAWNNDAELVALMAAHAPHTTGGGPRIHVIAHTHVPSAPVAATVGVLPRDPASFARAIYAELHRCDASGATHIFAEALPATPEWRALADRLKRASAD